MTIADEVADEIADEIDGAGATRAGPVVPPVPQTLLGELAFSLGEAGARIWLEEARQTARELMARWGLTPREVLTGGTMSLCLRCEDTTGAHCVLKVPASAAGGAAERGALRAWAGDGAARLLREDEASSALLMNFLGQVGVGGYGLTDLVSLTERLHRAESSGFAFDPVEVNLAHRITGAAQRFAEGGDQRLLDDLARAETVLVDLLPEQPRVLLHGDLQAKNLIVSGEGLTVVDPLPVLGPADFDLAFWIAKTVHARPTATYVDRVVTLRPALDRDALLRWTWALAVLEHRPHVPAGREQRRRFIEDHRPT